MAQKEITVIERLKAQCELTRKEIQKASDPAFIHHKQYTKELPKDNIGGSQFVELKRIRSRRVHDRKTLIEAIFNTGSATEPGKVTHVQRIIMEDLVDILNKDVRMTLQQKVAFAINQGDLRIGCTCSAYCFDQYTRIKLIDGRTMTIKDLKKLLDSGEKLYVYSVDSAGNHRVGKVNKVWVSGTAKKMVKVTLDNGKSIVTTPAHMYIDQKGKELTANKLTAGIRLRPIYKDDVTSHKVKKVEVIEYPIAQEVYDLEIDKYNNVGLEAGVVLHNSFWGYAFIATSMKYVHPGNWETRKPDIRNPQLRGTICKHLDLVLKVMPFNIGKMSKQLKDWKYKDDPKKVKNKRTKGEVQ